MQILTGTNTSDPTITPTASVVVDGDPGSAANLGVTPLQAILNAIGWLRKQCALLNMGGLVITNHGVPSNPTDVAIKSYVDGQFPIGNSKQSFGTPSAGTDVAIKSYVDGKVPGAPSYLATQVWATGWGNAGGSYQNVRFAKDSSGYVTLEGVVLNSNSGLNFTTNQLIMTLPAGYRPTTLQDIPAGYAGTGGMLGLITIDSSGAVYFACPGAGSTVTEVWFGGHMRFQATY